VDDVDGEERAGSNNNEKAQAVRCVATLVEGGGRGGRSWLKCFGESIVYSSKNLKELYKNPTTVLFTLIFSSSPTQQCLSKIVSPEVHDHSVTLLCIKLIDILLLLSESF
jgi:hypothetical protein